MDNIYDLLEEAEEVFGRVTPDMRLEIENVHQSRCATGQRLMKKAGAGLDFFDLREFAPLTDEVSSINHRASMRLGRHIVVEREVESPHRYGLWLDSSKSMDFKSPGARFTKKEAAVITMLALTQDLARQEEAVGIISHGQFYRGRRRASQRIAPNLADVTIMGGKDIPEIHPAFKAGNTVIIFSDFLPSDDNRLVEFLDDMADRNLHVFLVMVLDPSELTYDLKGHLEIRGREGEVGPTGEASIVFGKAESMRAQYLAALRQHIIWLQNLCNDRGFRFVLQPTHMPLENAIEGLKEGQDTPLSLVAEYHPD